MNKIAQIKLTLQKILMKFGEKATDKGLLSYVGDDLEVGMEVLLNDEIAPDGDYEVDNMTIRVADGKVAEIILKEETPVEEIEAAEEEAPAEEIVEEIPVEDPAPAEEPDLQAIILEVLSPVMEKVAALEARVEATEARLQEIETKLLEAQAKPADEVIEEVEPESGFFRAGYNKKR